MLVIANGAFKSGSTWVFNILRELTAFPPPPDEFLNPKWLNPSLDESKIERFLNSTDLARNNFLVKNHIDSKRIIHALVHHPLVRVVNVERALGDAIVSAFHHHRRLGDITADFDKYYWTMGRYEASRIQRYNNVWRSNAGSRVSIVRYEDLLEDFPQCVRTLACLVDLDVDEDEIARIKGATSMDNLRKRYGDSGGDPRFFREGKSGSASEMMDERMTRDLESVKFRGIGRVSVLSGKLKRIRLKRRLRFAESVKGLIRMFRDGTL